MGNRRSIERRQVVANGMGRKRRGNERRWWRQGGVQKRRKKEEKGPRVNAIRREKVKPGVQKRGKETRDEDKAGENERR